MTAEWPQYYLLKSGDQFIIAEALIVIDTRAQTPAVTAALGEFERLERAAPITAAYLPEPYQSEAILKLLQGYKKFEI